MNKTSVRVDAQTIRPGDQVVDQSGEWVVVAGEPVYDKDGDDWTFPIEGGGTSSVADYHDVQVIRSSEPTSQ